MERFEPRWKTQVKKIARNLGSGVRRAKLAHDVARRPVSVAVDKGAHALERWGSRPSRKGVVRNRVQHYNPKTKKWVKQDTKTGRIIGQKRTTGRYRNVRSK